MIDVNDRWFFLLLLQKYTYQCASLLISSFKTYTNTIYQVPVVRKMDNAIHWINREPVDKYFQSNILDLSPCAILVY